VRLTRAQFEQAAAKEESQLRVSRLQRMSYQELQALLCGDPVKAAVWIRSAAEHGIPAAQLRFGRVLLEGRGIPRDERAALSWFRRAAEQGDAEAQNMVGRCHENGWGVPVDWALAAWYFRRSAEAGHDWGQYNLANTLFDGRGVLRDLPQALYWFACAALQGHARAMSLVGRCLEEGWGCLMSREDAVYWYRRSAQSGYFRGQLNYALALAEQGEEVAAAHWFWKAATGGNCAIRRVILGALATASAPALVEVARRVRELAQSD
jgi:uncharacterized protein